MEPPKSYGNAVRTNIQENKEKTDLLSVNSDHSLTSTTKFEVRYFTSLLHAFQDLDNLQVRIDNQLTDDEKEAYLRNKMYYIGIWTSV